MGKYVGNVCHGCATSALLLLVSACSTGRHAAEAPGGFEVAARSWVGASIEEMIAHWGEPTRVSNERAEDGTGIAHWRSGGRSGIGVDAGSSNRCAVDAYYLDDRIIRRVEVSGRGCEERYAEHLETLTR